ncbi:fumarylacetoacetate hydrolase family protein, partial [candidate division KSB1 bacterium]
YIIDLNWGSRHIIEAEGLENIREQIPSDMVEFFNAGRSAFEDAEKVEKYAKSLIRKKEFNHGFICSAEKVKIGTPVLNPGKIICIGLNYRDHCAEQGVDIPKSPVIFSKFSTAVTGHDDFVVKPSISKKVDYEAELAFVIRKEGRWINKRNWKKYVAGYTIMNDISARDLQFSDGQWIRGKTFDTFAPFGPYLVTTDEIEDPHKLKIRLILNGKIMQNSNTSNLIFDIPYLIAYISNVVTLKPGDIVTTGTPPGVGIFRKPPVLLKHNDEIEVYIEKIGKLRNKVISESYYKKYIKY